MYRWFFPSPLDAVFFDHTVLQINNRLTVEKKKEKTLGKYWINFKMAYLFYLCLI